MANELRCWIYDRPMPGLFDDAVGTERKIMGRLTTDHARSSYGHAVFVADDGTAYGPADCPSGTATVHALLRDRVVAGADGIYDQDHPMVAAAELAGYVVDRS